MIEVITYADLDWGDDYDGEAWYPDELARWRMKSSALRDAGKCQLLIQHDVDSGPQRSMAMVHLERTLGLRSNVMIFNQRVDRARLRQEGQLAYTDYLLDDALLSDAERDGFVIGFHFNSMERAAWNKGLARRLFEKDLSELRTRHSIDFVSAHGGVAGPDGSNNRDLLLPDQRRLGVRWVHNGQTPRFTRSFSDGGLNRGKVDPATRDLRNFIGAFAPGERYRVLLHPQYYDADSAPKPAPGMQGTPWYDALFAQYEIDPSADSWGDVELAW